MAGAPASSPDDRRGPPPSDPALSAGATKWSDWTLPTRKLPFQAGGSIGTTSWTALAAKTAGAFHEVGLELQGQLVPRHEPYSAWGPMAEPGYGYLIGEAALQRSSPTIFFASTYSSFVATVQLWVDPPLEKATKDTLDTPHGWKALVKAGQVVSADASARGGGPFRMFRKIVAVDPAYGWIPSALLKLIR